jgi:hypothetical protein
MSLQLLRPQFLTVEEVAELLRVSPRSVYDGCRNVRNHFARPAAELFSSATKSLSGRVSGSPPTRR